MMFTVVSGQDPRHPLSQVYPMDVDLNLEGQNIENLTQLRLYEDGGQGLLMEGYTISDEGQAQKIVLDYQNDEWDILNSNLNLNGNNITGLDTLQFETGMTINGSINTSGGSVNLDSGSINNVYSIGGGGDSINFRDKIDMQNNSIIDSEGDLEIDSGVYIPGGTLDMAGNNIQNPGNVDGVDLDSPGNGLIITDSKLGIETDAIGNEELNNSESFKLDGLETTSDINMSGNNIQTGGGTVAIRDTTGVQDIVRFNEGGSIEVPSGTLSAQKIKVQNGNNIDLYDSGNLQWSIQDDSSNNELGFYDGSRDALRLNSGGKLEVPSGNLDLKVEGQDSGNDITNVGAISGRDNLYLEGQGSSQGVVIQQGDGNKILEAGKGDTDVQVANSLQVSNPANNDNSLDVGGSLGVEGALDMNQNTVSSVDTVEGVSGQEMALTVSETGGDELVLDSTGDVRVENGNLDLQGSSIVDSTSSNTVYVGDGTDDSVVLDAPNNVEIEGGNLDLQGTSIKNYYDNSCPNGETLVDIQDNGDFQCMNVANEVMDVYVNRSGDTMKGDLDMQTNNIVDVGSQGIGTDTPQENLDVDGTASIENSGTRMEVDSTGDVVVTLGQ